MSNQQSYPMQLSQLLEHTPTLKADHSNLSNWKISIQRSLKQLTQISGLFESRKQVSKDEDELIRKALVSTVDPVYAFIIDRSTSYYEAYQSIIEPRNIHSHHRTTHAAIFREIVTTRFDLLNQDMKELETHFENFQKKIHDLDRSGFTFTREQVLRILYQITLNDHLFEHINNKPDLQATPNLDEDPIIKLVRSQLEAFGEQSGSITPSHIQNDDRQSNLYTNRIIPQKRTADDSPIKPIKAQRKFSSEMPDQITDTVSPACGLMPTASDVSAQNHIHQSGSTFETPFYDHLAHTTTESVDELNQRAKDFFEWCADRNVYIHPQLVVKFDSELRQLFFKILPSSGDQPMIIPKDSIMTSTPHALCFSHQTSSLSTNPNLYQKFTSTSSSLNSESIIKTVKEHLESESLCLTIHLAHELSLGRDSPWFPYLNLISHPVQRIPAMIHLLVDQVPQLENWLQGTEIASQLGYFEPDDISSGSLSFLKEHFRTCYPQDHITWECFIKAYAIVSTKALYCNKFHGLALVPIADIFNPSFEPDVTHWRVSLSDDPIDCCTDCILKYWRPDKLQERRLLELPSQSTNDSFIISSVHDLVPSPNPKSLPSSSSTATPVEINGELTAVYSCYDYLRCLPNSHLLTQYGLMISANSSDLIWFEYEDIISVCVESIAKENKVEYSSEQLSDELCIPSWWERLKPDENNTLINLIAHSESHQSIGSHSKLSGYLWSKIVKVTWVQIVGRQPSFEELNDIYVLQNVINSMSEPTLKHLPSTHALTATVVRMLYWVSRTVVNLIEDRLEQYYLPGLQIEDLLKLKEIAVAEEKTFEKGSRIRIPVYDDYKKHTYSLQGLIPTAIDYAIMERKILTKALKPWSHVNASALHLINS